MQALMEFQLRTNLGCCFSLFDQGENDLMWRSYTPDPDCGVIVVLRAGVVKDAMSCLGTNFRRNYFAKVRYLSEDQAKWMKVEGCAHSRTKKGKISWDVCSGQAISDTAIGSFSALFRSKTAGDRLPNTELIRSLL